MSEICEICDKSDNTVKCVHCGVSVHRDCYGYPLVKLSKTKKWTCLVCGFPKDFKTKNEQFKCALCPNRKGAMKKATDWRWVHLRCALWIPEAFFYSTEGREPIDLLRIPPKRFSEKCSYCKKGGDGACLSCSTQNCKMKFHVPCGINKNVFLTYRSNKKSQIDEIFSYCHLHSEYWRNKASNAV
ncbi:hypothetical protein MHBO_002058 [Bonamia ostreae]|uniref:Uncharacterized protein n=1 Tax=Bonamia ostreae TaxID=126728 RepID=A0ABV2AL10_9EUKA